MDETTVLVETRDEKIATLTLNRPEKRNALTIPLMEAFCAAIADLESKPAVRALIVRGAGPMFCTGLDLAVNKDYSVAEKGAALVAKCLQRIVESPLVTIAACQGAAYAGGAGIMAACDFVVAADDLRICFPEVRRGLVPALVSAVVRHRVSLSEMRRQFLLAQPIEATYAKQIGLVDRIVPVDRLFEGALEIASETLRGAPQAVRETKRLLREMQPISDAEVLRKHLEIHTRARGGDEAVEGLAAFLEKREPAW